MPVKIPLRQASPDEFRKVAESCLSFDEPMSRWAHLRRGLSRLAQNGAAPHLAALPQDDQDFLFTAAYGSSDRQWHNVNMITNIILAYSEMQRLQPTAFAWLSDSPSIPVLSSQKTLADCKQIAAPIKKIVLSLQSKFTQSPAPAKQDTINVRKLLEAIIMHEKLSESEMGWLRHALQAVPDWHRLKDEGFRQDDAKAQLIVLLMTHIERSFNSDLPIEPKSIFYDALDFFQEELSKRRPKISATFLPQIILLVEGQTEFVLLSHFANCLKLDFDSKGILLKPVGGANQIKRQYLKLRDLVKIPIYCLLDGDAISQAEDLEKLLRSGDRLYSLNAIDIESTFPSAELSLFVNKYFVGRKEGLMHTPIMPADIGPGSSAKALAKIWRQRGIRTFDKIGFARTITQIIREPMQIPAELRSVIKNICQ